MVMIILLLFFGILFEPGASENIISRGKPTSQSSVAYDLDSSLAVDGRYENYIHIAQTSATIHRNCFHTYNDKNPFWEVDLQGEFSIFHVVIYNRVDCCSERLVGSTVELLNQTGDVSFQCGTISENKPVYRVSCGQNRAYKVRVEAVPSQYLHLCEVDVIGESIGDISQVPIIISREKETSQSSVYRNLTSSIGVDGRYENYLKLARTGSLLYPNCFHTNDDPVPFWMVDLQGSFKIDHVLIYNRMDAVSERAVGVVVELLNEYGKLSYQCGQINNSKEIYHIPCDNKMASKVRIRALPKQYLHFCEIEVFTGLEPPSAILPLISRGKPTSMSSVAYETDSSIAVDGKYDNIMQKSPSGTNYLHCFHTNAEANPFWVVDLQGLFEIDQVVLYNRADCCSDRLIGAVVELLSLNGEVTHECKRITESQTIYYVPCTRNLAYKIRVRGAANNYLHLCEIDVFGGRAVPSLPLVSRGRPTWMSSKAYGTDASIAVDGKYDSFMQKAATGGDNYKNCFHTNADANPFWVVNLQGPFKIGQIVLYNRVDCCSERLVGAVIELLNKNGTVTHECGTIEQSRPVYYLSCENHVGNLVQVRGAKNQYLHLCEVEVFGEGVS